MTTPDIDHYAKVCAIAASIPTGFDIEDKLGIALIGVNLGWRLCEVIDLLPEAIEHARMGRVQ